MERPIDRLVIVGTPLGATLTTGYLLAGDLIPENRTPIGFPLLILALNAGAPAGYALGGQLTAHGSAAEGFPLSASAARCRRVGAARLGLALR